MCISYQGTKNLNVKTVLYEQEKKQSPVHFMYVYSWGFVKQIVHFVIVFS